MEERQRNDVSLFVQMHQEQLESLQIPLVLVPLLEHQLQQLVATAAAVTTDDTDEKKEQLLVTLPARSLAELRKTATITTHGALLVLPHLCTWNVSQFPSTGLWDALSALSNGTLQAIWNGLLQQSQHQASSSYYDSNMTNKHQEGGESQRLELLNTICGHERIWSHIILFVKSDDECVGVSSSSVVMAALPPPPYFPQVPLLSMDDNTHQADVASGPFPFVYRPDTHSETEASTLRGSSVCQVSCLYLAPTSKWTNCENEHILVPTMDYCPSDMCANQQLRAVRLAALLGSKDAPRWAIQTVTHSYHSFVKDHQQKQQQQQQILPQQQCNEWNQPNKELKQGQHHPPAPAAVAVGQQRLLRVYTDANDPMRLSHAETGLDPTFYTMTDSLHDADIIFSFHSLFAAGSMSKVLEQRRMMVAAHDSSTDDSSSSSFFINQFPYEGAFLQKDHLARELLLQYGLPRPVWAIETYDLDVHLAEFVGAAIVANNNHDANNNHARQQSSSQQLQTSRRVLWICKPARGTQSKGHVVTDSIAHILKLVDAGGGSRVVQRYIANPVLYDGKKVDCRCLVLMTNAGAAVAATSTTAACTNNQQQRPTLYMHRNVFFRIARHPHRIATPADWMDPHAVLTAGYLLPPHEPTSRNNNGDEEPVLLDKVPADDAVIAKLQHDYGDAVFDWNGRILPQMHTMIRELFTGMTRRFPSMAASTHSRALYGVDVMFEIVSGCDNNTDNVVVVPRLTEVTFCPTNNAVGNTHVVDDGLRKNYTTDVFNCLFRGVVSDRIVRLQ